MTAHSQLIKSGRAKGVLATLCAVTLLILPVAPASAASYHQSRGKTSAQRATPPADKLGQHDRDLLARAQAKGRRHVTALVAAQPGQAGRTIAQVRALGGKVTYRNNQLGYVRAQLPTTVVERTAKLRSVAGVDLSEMLRLDNPRPDTTGTAAAQLHPTALAAATEPPGPATPAANPYLPIDEIGAVRFMQRYPGWDGRGVTVGILDTGVDLDHPALQTTTTGQPKIRDWLTSTDPVTDGDDTWLMMDDEVTGPSFTRDGHRWTAPEGTFSYARFAEEVTKGSEYDGDVNRDGDTTDAWGVLYSATEGTVTVDTNRNHDFTDDTPMRPYRDEQQVGHFGEDRQSTPVRESVPFVVQIRRDVDLEPLSQPGTADFVNIGLATESHGTHVAGIMAGNGLFAGGMTGVAPGAQIVSSRACTFAGVCSSVGLTEGMIDLVTRRGVDVVNVSIGGLPPMNDGSSARAAVYNRLIADYGVQIVAAAGNDGPGLNTVGEPGVATQVLSVGATVSRGTWLANYGVSVAARREMLDFSAAGPAEDGALKPDLTAPGAAISTIPIWQRGVSVPQAGYLLAPGYAMYNGTSMAAPMAVGGLALLLSASRASNIPVTAGQLRRAVLSGASFAPDLSAAAQGSGQLDVVNAWRYLRHAPRLEVRRYAVSAPVCTAISRHLLTPERGPGLFQRCQRHPYRLLPGVASRYPVTITRQQGPDTALAHRLTLLGNDGSFRTQRNIRLPLGAPVTLEVTVTATGPGAHSALLQLDDAATAGVDQVIPLTVVVPEAGTAVAEPAPDSGGQPPAATVVPAPVDQPWSDTSLVARTGAVSYFVAVPRDTRALHVQLSDLAVGSHLRFIAFHPYGMPVDSTEPSDCYAHYSDPTDCNPVDRTYPDPTPGIWELSVQARRTTPTLDNPFRIAVELYGVSIEPATAVVATARPGTPEPVSWQLTNQFAPVTVLPEGSPLGSSHSQRPTIAAGEQRTYEVVVPADAERFEATIGSPSDLGADLDLTVLRNGEEVGSSAEGDSEEQVVIKQPKPGSYTVVVSAYDVPEGSTEFDYRDVFYAEALGWLDVDNSAKELTPGTSVTLTGEVMVGEPPAQGRHLYGQLNLRSEGGVLVGTGGAQVGRVTPLPVDAAE